MESSALFEFGTLGFWLLVFFVSIVLIICTEVERGTFATFTFIAAIIVIHVWGGEVWGGKKLLSGIAAEPGKVLGYAGIYLLLGTFWGVNKWWWYVKGQRRKYDEALNLLRAQFQKPEAVEEFRRNTEQDRRYHSASQDPRSSKDARDVETVFRETWKGYVEAGHYRGIDFEFKPDPKEHKPRILIWMTYWPWSFLWTILRDPFKAIYHRIVGLLKRISIGAFKDVGDPVLGENPTKQEKP